MSGSDGVLCCRSRRVLLRGTGCAFGNRGRVDGIPDGEFGADRTAGLEECGEGVWSASVLWIEDGVDTR